MDMFSLTSAHYPHTSRFSASVLAAKHHTTTTSASASASASTPSLTLSLKSPTPGSDNHTVPSSDNLRRPITHNPLKTSPSKPTSPKPKITTNPLKNLVNRTNNPNTNSQGLTDKLWLTSKLSPLPPPPSPPLHLLPEETLAEENEIGDSGTKEPPRIEFRQEGKIFVGNLPLWIKKHEFAEFFRQFGPIKNVILIKGHNDTERNMGFGFVIYGGPTAEKSAMNAVEFDGVEFHGRVLTVKLDDGRRMKERSAERARWVEGADGVEYKSKWHEEREGSRREFQKVLETQPENWQAVVRAFERIKKPSRKEFGLMVNYYARRGDMHRARETFEGMRARGIEPTSHVYTNLIHAYAVGRDMEEALTCLRKMKDEGIELSLVTYSIMVGGFAKVSNVDAADQWFKEAKERHATLNAIIYGNIIYAQWMVWSPKSLVESLGTLLVLFLNQSIN